ncbi:MAG: N-acetylmuramoyl-L-alanine amidase [Negativicutes bacterium]|nr:N-acetylmuramoyl-L-alanine amidase [Negativicutes bacterium]
MVRVLRLRWQSLKLLAAFGVAVLATINLMVAEYPITDGIEKADLTVLAGKVIVVDPGHGGIDSGAKYSGLEEKDIVLSLSLKLGELLRQYGATVIFTRESDVDYYTRGRGGKRNDLLYRVDLINKSGANLYISIHTNAIAGSRWSGAEVYYNSRLAENKKLAEIMQLALQGFPPGNKRQAKQDSNILVLKDTSIPGILVEAGFLSNPQEAAMLADGAYQQKIAEHIARALAYHFSSNVAR